MLQSRRNRNAIRNCAYNTEMRNLRELPSPCYLFDEAAIEKNLARARQLRDADCRVLLALKSFAVWRLFPLLRDSLAGVSASSLNEARLGADEFGGEVHLYAPAYRADEFAALRKYASHIVFNSRAQWEKFGGEIKNSVLRNPRQSRIFGNKKSALQSVPPRFAFRNRRRRRRVYGGRQQHRRAAFSRALRTKRRFAFASRRCGAFAFRCDFAENAMGQFRRRTFAVRR